MAQTRVATDLDERKMIYLVLRIVIEQKYQTYYGDDCRVFRRVGLLTVSKLSEKDFELPYPSNTHFGDGKPLLSDGMCDTMVLI